MEPVRLLRERGIEPCIYYANSNIHPASEYAHRRDTIRDWAAKESVGFVEGAYDPDAWEATAGRVGEAAHERFGVIADDHAADQIEDQGGSLPTQLAHNPEALDARRARCRACYRIRFEEAARYAAENGYDTLGTTLSVSPYQYTDVIREELERACAGAGIEPMFEDYRPFYDEATRRSRAEGLYRQNFCGCRFSDEEAQVERAERKRVRDAAKAAERAAHAAERAAEDAARAERKAERAAYDKKQARKRAVLKALREQQRAQQQ